MENAISEACRREWCMHKVFCSESFIYGAKVLYIDRGLSLLRRVHDYSH